MKGPTRRAAGHPRKWPRTIQIVATPGSGNGRGLATALALHEALRARGHPARLEVFSDLDDLRRWAVTGRPNLSLLVCVGGDGTQSAAALAALSRVVPLLPVPSGFGNLFARALHHPRGVEPVVDLVEHGTVVGVDVGLRNGEPFLCQESYGLLSEIQDRTEAVTAQPRTRWRRCLAYYGTALAHARDATLHRWEVTVDGQVVASDAVVVTVANVAAYGAWLELTPGASPIDGLLDVFVMRGATKREILARLLRRHLRLPGTERGTLLCRGRRVTVASPHYGRDELGLMPRRLSVLVRSETVEALRRDQTRVHGLSRAA